jgi:predicted oxidoreductase
MTTKNKFSKLIAGTMTWGIWGKNFSTDEMNTMIHHCVGNGITTFDHADIYGDYTTEAAFGKALIQSKIEREKIQLISKCGIAMPVHQDLSQHMEGRNNTIKHYNYSKEYIIWSVENSLKNLQTEYLDLLLLHRPSPLMQADEIAEAVSELKFQGKILDFGVSNFTTSQTELILQRVKINYNQIPFSVTHLQPMLDGSLDNMQLHKITPMSWNPLGSVFKEITPQTERLLKLLKTLEKQYNVTDDVLLLAWIMQHPSGVLPVFGTTNQDRIKNYNKAIGLKLELQDWFAIWTESIGNKVP